MLKLIKINKQIQSVIAPNLKMQLKQLDRFVQQGQRNLNKIMVTVMMRRQQSLKALHLSHRIKSLVPIKKNQIIQKLKKKVRKSTKIIKVCQGMHYKFAQLKFAQKQYHINSGDFNKRLKNHKSNQKNEIKNSCKSEQLIQVQNQIKITDLFQQISQWQHIYPEFPFKEDSDSFMNFQKTKINQTVYQRNNFDRFPRNDQFQE